MVLFIDHYVNAAWGRSLWKSMSGTGEGRPGKANSSRTAQTAMKCKSMSILMTVVTSAENINLLDNSYNLTF